jgi:membrane protein DedA with SNARE-associated domain
MIESQYYSILDEQQNENNICCKILAVLLYLIILIIISYFFGVLIVSHSNLNYSEFYELISIGLIFLVLLGIVIIMIWYIQKKINSLFI